MGKLSNALRGAQPSGPQGPITTEKTASGTTYNGGVGYTYDDKSQLFLLGVTNFVGEDTFYEDAKGRDTRFRDLVRKNVVADPVWTAGFLRWLRHEANMRSASIVGAVEAAKALSAMQSSGLKPKNVDDSQVTPRQIMDSVLRRADEPGEALGYWLNVYGKPLPKWLKRALGDAALRLYTQFNILKWDSPRNPVRFADVIEFSQIGRPRGVPVGGIFSYLLDDRHGRGKVDELPLLAANKGFHQIDKSTRRLVLRHESFGRIMDEAGITWEALSGWLGGPMDAEAWENAIPRMRYGAIIKNLANFERAGINKLARDRVIDILTDPTGIHTSRLLPMAFLNAYNNVPGDTFKAALDEAATTALGNVPTFEGSTLILIDTSGSMNAPFTTHRGRRNPDAEQLMRWDAAALFGITLGMNCALADVVSFSSGGWGYYRDRSRHSNGQKAFPLRRGENLLRAVNRFRKNYFIGGGTDTAGAVEASFSGHNRVVVLTDEQADLSPGGVYAPIPAGVPVYTFNLAGYSHGHAQTAPNRFTVGGLSDAAFKLIASVESTTKGKWPWQ